MCPLIKELKKNKSVSLSVLSTGQHRAMLDDVLKKENIKADYDFSLMKIGQTLSYLTVEALSRTEKVIDELLPDLILVHGDTTTAFAGALAGFYKRVPVAHVEAGLRTFDNQNPYPEEFNRRAISAIASYHFAPTEQNRQNLLSEGVSAARIFVTGNTVIDALVRNLKTDYSHAELPRESFIILTAHRRESLGEGMENIFLAASELSKSEKIKIIYPIHKNEKIVSLAEKVFSGNEFVKIIAPLSPADFHNFLYRCKFVITDSGGVQEEASFLGKPLIVVRKCTERKELLTKSVIKLVGNDKNSILKEARKLISNTDYYRERAVSVTEFGEGNASLKISNAINEILLKT